jgi:hypothetical protein
VSSLVVSALAAALSVSSSSEAVYSSIEEDEGSDSNDSGRDLASILKGSGSRVSK